MTYGQLKIVYDQIFSTFTLLMMLFVARTSPQVFINYPGGFVSVPSRGQAGQVQVAYPGGFVNVPRRPSTIINTDRMGEVQYPGGIVNFGR